MTVHLDATRPDTGGLEQPKSTGDQNRTLKIAVAIFGVVALVLGVVLIADTSTKNDSAPPDDVSQVLDDYIAAWENQDVDGFRAVVTDDFFLTEEIFELDGSRHAKNGGVRDVADGVEETDYDVEFFGDMIVTGDGPWFVVVGENWIDQFDRLDGTAGYVIVDDAGTLKISDHHWAGVRSPILDWQE